MGRGGWNTSTVLKPCNILFSILIICIVTELQALNQLLLLLEDVLELSQGGLHLLQGELVLSLDGLVLGDPGVELGDGVVQQHPLLHQHLALLHPGLGHGLHLVEPGLEGGHLGVGLGVGGHLEGGALGGSQHLQVVDTSLVEGQDLVIESLDLAEVRRLGETLAGGLLSACQPWGELFDASPVLVPEHLGVSGHLVALGQELSLGGGAGLQDLELGGNVLLQVHGPGNSVLGQHSTRRFLDVLQLSSGGILPVVNGLDGVVKCSEAVDKVYNDLNSGLKSAKDFQLLFNSLDFLGQDLLLVIGNGDGHGVVVFVDVGEQTINFLISVLEDLLSFGKISISCLEVEDLLDLLDFLLGKIKFPSNDLAVLSISNEGLLGLIKELKSVIGLLLGVIPTVLETLDIGLKELGFVRVLQDDLALGNEICDHSSLGVELSQGLLLPLDQLVNILNARGGDVPGGGQHDTVQELNMGLQLVTVGVALPVEVHHDGGLLN